MHVAEENERARVGQLHFLEEVLHFDRVVALWLVPDDSLDLLQLVSLGGGLDVFEVDLLIVRGVDDGAWNLIKGFYLGRSRVRRRCLRSRRLLCNSGRPIWRGAELRRWSLFGCFVCCV